VRACDVAPVCVVWPAAHTRMQLVTYEELAAPLRPLPRSPASPPPLPLHCFGRAPLPKSSTHDEGRGSGGGTPRTPRTPTVTATSSSGGGSGSGSSSRMSLSSLRMSGRGSSKDSSSRAVGPAASPRSPVGLTSERKGSGGFATGGDASASPSPPQELPPLMSPEASSGRPTYSQVRTMLLLRVLLLLLVVLLLLRLTLRPSYSQKFSVNGGAFEKLAFERITSSWSHSNEDNIVNEVLLWPRQGGRTGQVRQPLPLPRVIRPQNSHTHAVD